MSADQAVEMKRSRRSQTAATADSFTPPHRQGITEDRFLAPSGRKTTGSGMDGSVFHDGVVFDVNRAVEGSAAGSHQVDHAAEDRKVIGVPELNS